MRMIRLMTGLLLGGLIAMETRAELASEVIGRPSPLVIAHRGDSIRSPENTLPAFRLALAARADLVELDYHHSADGVPVVIHDSTLDRTTDATNRWGGRQIALHSRTAAELAELEAGSWFAPAFRGTRIPTLHEALETIQAGGMTLIERKAGNAQTLARLLQEGGWTDRVVVQSFDWAFVRAMRELAPELILGALGPPSVYRGRKLADHEKELSAGFVTEVHETGARCLVWNRQVNREGIQIAHRLGLKVWVYTINDPDEATRLVALGVDGIITDDPVRVGASLRPEPDEEVKAPATRRVPVPRDDHPGNVYLEGQEVSVRLPDGLPGGEITWRLLDDRNHETRRGQITGSVVESRQSLELGALGAGWYRIEFDGPGSTNRPWTTAAVLPRLRAPVPGDSPVCVDSATAWFARNDPEGQGRLANLAALAGVNWVRDRLRWGELQPTPGALIADRTTYDTAAEIQHREGLKVLQVFHDTPPWGREEPRASGRFAPDLRHVYRLGAALADRFHGRVQAWEPWNEANVATFGGHTVDRMCSWQKAAWLGFKSRDPTLIVGWNVTAAVPTPAQTVGVLANETWPFYDTYNIHTYDWSHAYADLWAPARAATAGRPLWITEADRGTRHLGNEPWFDIEPRLERLKAEWIAQSYASSLFAGGRRHFHFILGHYHEPNEVQFGLLRLDLTPRPAYVALAAVGRHLAGARVLGRWRPIDDLQVHAFRARPDGVEQDVLVIWAERDVEWAGRGGTAVEWRLPNTVDVLGAWDYLGRERAAGLPKEIRSAPWFVHLPAGQASTLPLEPPPALAPRQSKTRACPVVLQLTLPRSAEVRVEDLPWSEGHAYAAAKGEWLELPIEVYNFASDRVEGGFRVADQPPDWQVEFPDHRLRLDTMERETVVGRLRLPEATQTGDGWVVLRGEWGPQGKSALAFRVRTKVSRNPG
jgi:glycerophosphoryl diester phosphodiesterase